MAKVDVVIGGDSAAGEAAVKRMQTQLDNLTASVKSAQGPLDSLKGMFAALGVTMAAVKVFDYAKDAAMMAARYETLGVTMQIVGNNAGYTGEQMAGFQSKLQATGIAMTEARATLVQLAQAHVDLSKSSQLARIAQDAAVIGGINSSEAFQRMTYGIQSAQVEVLRTIGINVNFETSYKKLALQLHKSVEELTETEKTQARVNIVMEKGRDIAGAYEAAMGTAGKQMTSMQRYMDDLKVKIGEVFLNSLTVATAALTKEFQGLNKEAEDLSRAKQLAEWGRDAVKTLAFIADAVQGTYLVFKTLIQTVVYAGESLFGLGSIARNVFEGDFKAAGTWVDWVNKKTLEYKESLDKSSASIRNFQGEADKFNSSQIKNETTLAAMKPAREKAAGGMLSSHGDRVGETKQVLAQMEIEQQRSGNNLLRLKEEAETAARLLAIKTAAGKQALGEQLTKNEIQQTRLLGKNRLDMLKEQYDQMFVTAEEYYDAEKRYAAETFQDEFDLQVNQRKKLEALIGTEPYAAQEKKLALQKDIAAALGKESEMLITYAGSVQKMMFEGKKGITSFNEQRAADQRNMDADLRAMQIQIETLKGYDQSLSSLEKELYDGKKASLDLQGKLNIAVNTGNQIEINGLTQKINLQSQLNIKKAEQLDYEQQIMVLKGSIVGFSDNKPIYSKDATAGQYQYRSAAEAARQPALNPDGTPKLDYWGDPINVAGNSINKFGLPNFGPMATGTNYIPSDGYAYLHQGEAVVPKQFNPAAGGSAASSITVEGGITFNLPNVTNQTTARELARQVWPEIQALQSGRFRQAA